MRKLTNKSLKKAFDQFNKAYFNNELPHVVVKFDTEGELDDDDYGEFTVDGRILIDEQLAYVPDYCYIVLLHEMAHVKSPEASNHGFHFAGVIDLLYKKGAYDTYL